MAARIDKTISKVSGASNYMEQLSQVTGNMNSITEDYYIKQIDKVINIYAKCVVPELDKYNTDEIRKLAKKIQTDYEKLDLSKLYVEKVKKSGKKTHSVRIRPRDIYDSDWFKSLKSLEDRCVELSEQFEIVSTGMSEIQSEIIKNNPGVVESFTFYGNLVNSVETINSVYICRKYINKIIEILLNPMYDSLKFIKDHWVAQIDTAIGAELRESKNKTESVTRDEIQNYVHTFVLAKYRLSLTGNSDQFAKILLSSMDDYDIASMDPSRFITVIDGLNLEGISGSENLKGMAQLAKDEISKIMGKKDITTAEILQDVEKFLNYGDNLPEELPESTIKDSVFD